MTTATTAPVNAPAANTAAARQTPLKQQLTELVKVEGIVMAVVVSRDGFVIDGVSNGNSLELEAVGAVVSAGMSSGLVMGKELQLGAIQQTMAEYERGFIVAMLLGEAGSLAVVADLKANLGHVRYHIKKHAAAMVASL
jgi:predicted regulator of Ras-like GTPase activity (Roadblock/LC7/MglB family)